MEVGGGGGAPAGALKTDLNRQPTSPPSRTTPPPACSTLPSWCWARAPRIFLRRWPHLSRQTTCEPEGQRERLGRTCPGDGGEMWEGAVLGGIPWTRGASPVAQIVKNLPAMQETQGWIPGLRISPGEGNGNSLQCSFLENPMDRGARWATVYGVTKSHTRLSN